MSSSDSGQQKVRLIAEADEGTEIFVIDGGFRRVASALKRLETDLSPGLYTVKFKRGGALAEVDADLLPGSGPVRVQGPSDALAFSSPAPMAQTITSHETHQAKAAEVSARRPDRVGRGEGSGLFVFVRDIGVDGIGNPAEGMTLHDLRGQEVIDFGELGEAGCDRDASVAAWYGCNVELAPGFYRLRSPSRGMPDMEQALILVKDWHTQVFLVRDWRTSSAPLDISAEAHGLKGSVDLSRGTIFMSRPGHGFNPSDPSVRLTELVRQGLTSGRIPVTEEDLRQMLWGKFENPMLGLFAAHLLIPLLSNEQSLPLQRPADPEILKGNLAIQRVLAVAADGIVGPKTRHRLRQLIEEVAGNLEGMLGDHPDVNAIRRALTGNENIILGAQKAAVPPMLRRSWDTLVRTDPLYYRAKAGSILARIADRIWGVGPWLIWQVPPAAPRKTGFDPEEIQQAFSRFTKSAADAKGLERMLSKADLSSVEESIVRHSLLKTGAFEYGKAATAASSFETEQGKHETAKILGIPVITLERNLASAMTKIDAAAQENETV
jgi:hypothetical protein